MSNLKTNVWMNAPLTFSNYCFEPNRCHLDSLMFATVVAHFLVIKAVWSTHAVGSKTLPSTVLTYRCKNA